MVDSALSGGSTKTSVALSILDHFPTQAPCIVDLDPTEQDNTFDHWLSLLENQNLEFPTEERYDKIAADISDFAFTNDEDNHCNKQGKRKSAEDVKKTAFDLPIMQALGYIYQPCNQLCYLSGFCCRNISGKSILDLRNQYFRPEGKDAPKDKERGALIMKYLREAKKDKDNNIIFNIDGQDVCVPAFLRILGVSTSADITKAPGQWSRIIKEFLDEGNKTDDTLLNAEDLELNPDDCIFTGYNGHCKAFMNEVAMHTSDCIPMVDSEDGSTKVMQVPYGSVRSFFDEYEFHYQSEGYGPAEYASYSTFLRAFRELHRDGVLKLLGGKSGFNSCALCNNFISIKKSACCRRDQITKDVLKKLGRLHILQQSTERQHGENFIALSKIMKDGQPQMAYFDIDPQSTWTGNTPKMSKDRTSKTDCIIENRNIGVRIVCGPVDEYISICTNNLIPHGANVLVEVVRFIIEYLAKRLASVDPNMIIPKKVGFQFDNSGENKNKEMFCFFSHLIEDGYFTEIETFFLVVGHTHNILDQWFSVLGKAVKGAHFIGSVLAIHELYKIAHSDDESKQPALVHQLETYHDWRRFYEPVRNTEIQNYGIPLRFRFSIDNFLNVAKMEYMHMTPSHGFKHMEKWQPVAPPVTKQNANMDGNISLKRLGIFNGPGIVLEALGMEGTTNITDIAEGSLEDLENYDKFRDVMPVLRELEVRTIGESTLRIEQEAEKGYSDEHVTIRAGHLKQIDLEISRGNKNTTGRIVWLRRSKCGDPDHLQGRPDILPNPKLWRQRIANAYNQSKPHAEDPEEEESFSSVPKPTAESKKATADAAEAQQRLISFTRGAADIASTASQMLKLVDCNNVLSVASHNNIVLATNKFKRAILTPREVNWYRNRSSANAIISLTEKLVEMENQKPWKLLNLPEVTPAQQKRFEEQVLERERRYAQVEKNLRSLLLRDGEGEYDPDKQVVSFDGFTPAKTTDVAKMTRPQLEALAKCAPNKMKTKDIKALKVDQLRKYVIKLVEQHPELMQVPQSLPAETTIEATEQIISAEEHFDDSDENKCSVIEVYTRLRI